MKSAPHISTQAPRRRSADEILMDLAKVLARQAAAEDHEAELLAGGTSCESQSTADTVLTSKIRDR